MIDEGREQRLRDIERNIARGKVDDTRRAMLVIVLLAAVALLVGQLVIGACNRPVDASAAPPDVEELAELVAERVILRAQEGLCRPIAYVPMVTAWPTDPGWYRWERPKSNAFDQVGEWELLGDEVVLRLGPTTIHEHQIDEGWWISIELVRFPRD